MKRSRNLEDSASSGWRPWVFARFWHSWSFCVVLWALLVPSSRMLGQYYEPREYAPFEGRLLSLGPLLCDFRPRPDNTTPDSAVIDFRRWMPVVGFRQGPAEVMVGYTTYSLGGRTRSMVILSAQFSRDVPITGKRPGALVLPVALTADFTRADGIGLERDNFNVASVGLGAGLKYRYYTADIDFSVQVIQAAQFSSEGIGVGGGFSALTVGNVFLALHEVLLFDGVAVGYRVRYQTWAMNESKFNYRSFFHGPYLGIMF